MGKKIGDRGGTLRARVRGFSVNPKSRREERKGRWRRQRGAICNYEKRSGSIQIYGLKFDQIFFFFLSASSGRVGFFGWFTVNLLPVSGCAVIGPGSAHMINGPGLVVP